MNYNLMKIYLSWIQILFPRHENLIIDYGLVSFADVWNEKPFITNWWKINDLFLDSWWFAIRTRWLKLSVVDYAKYIQKYGSMYNVIANMDTKNVEETLKNQHFLEKETGKTITPIYHADEFIQWNHKLLEDYCANYDYVALWWIAGGSFKKNIIEKYYNFCFKTWMKYKTKFHWFWVTTDFFLKRYPFYSVDSTTWLSAGKFMRIPYFKNGRLYDYNPKYFHDQGISPWSPWQAQKRLRMWYQAWLKYGQFLDEYWKLRWPNYREMNT